MRLLVRHLFLTLLQVCRWISLETLVSRQHLAQTRRLTSFLSVALVSVVLSSLPDRPQWQTPRKLSTRQLQLSSAPSSRPLGRLVPQEIVVRPSPPRRVEALKIVRVPVPVVHTTIEPPPVPVPKPTRHEESKKMPAVTGNQVLQFLMQFEGQPYVWGGQAPGGFDCSGLMWYGMQ